MEKTLMLHRVLPSRSDGYYFHRGTAITFDRFRRMLDALQKYNWRSETPLCRVTRMAGAWQSGDADVQRVCITFDDGYADTAAALDEILARGMCATVFVVKDFSVTGFSPIDDLAAWLDANPDAPSALVASLTGGRLKKLVRNMSATRYRNLRWRYFARGDHPEAVGFMGERVIADYYRRGVAFGIHGTSHRVWSGMRAGEVRAEIVESACWLRGLGIKDIAGLCFPHGQYRDCQQLGGEAARLARVGMFGVDCAYADARVTRRVWIREDGDVEGMLRVG